LDWLKKILFSIIKLYSKRYNARLERLYLVHETSSHPIRLIDSAGNCPQFDESMSYFKEHLHREWVLDIREAGLIEPKKGIVFSPSGKFLSNSLNYPQYISYKNFPFKSFLKIIFRYPAQVKEAIFSLRDLNESNYWHFFDDEMSKLRLMEKVQVAGNIPVLVGERLWNTHFFQHVINNTGFSSYHWEIHVNIVKFNRLIIAVPSSLQAENFRFFLRTSEIRIEPNGAKIIFVNRREEQGRSISNGAEIAAILDKYSIPIIENDGLSFMEQVAIFKDAEILIAVHGAGLANLTFRIDQPTGLFELFHPDAIHPHYAWMCKAFGFKYDCLVGSIVDSRGNFHIDPQHFEKKIQSIVSHRLKAFDGPSSGVIR
jgi:hypothetical protein